MNQIKGNSHIFEGRGMLLSFHSILPFYIMDFMKDLLEVAN